MQIIESFFDKQPSDSQPVKRRKLNSESNKVDLTQYVRYIPLALSETCPESQILPLLSDLPWPSQRSQCRVFGKIHNVPRDQLFMHLNNDESSQSFRYSGMTLNSIVAPDFVRNLMKWIFEQVPETRGGKYDVVLINRYLNSKDKVGWHADDEKTIDHRFPIVSLSFGATRQFQMRYKPSRTLQPLDQKLLQKYSLAHGDVVVMLPGCQDVLQHQVPPGSRHQSLGIRYNLTFRAVI
jgi:alkylated DNA repair dioxygenase AlkB